KTCPDDQGCANGGCVPACDSAKANKSTIGCDYYAVQPEGSQYGGGCFAVFVANTWKTDVTLSVDYGGTMDTVPSFARIPNGSGQALTLNPLPPSGKLPSGQVAILFLSNTVGGFTGSCPANIGGAMPPHTGTDVSGTAIGKAYHITASAPVVAYDIYP